MCAHRPSCPAPGSPASGSPAPGSRTARVVAAHLVAAHPEQGWNLLCDGTVVFDDTGELRPDGRVVAPHRAPAGHGATATAARPLPDGALVLARRRSFLLGDELPQQ